jgi:Ca2+-transporting ATPase
MIIFLGGRAFSVTRLNGAQWGYSLVLGALSLPMAVIIRLIPDPFVAKFLPPRWRKRLLPEEAGSGENLARRYPLEQRSLSFIKTVRGGRLNSVKFELDDMQDHAGHEGDDKLAGPSMV